MTTVVAPRRWQLLWLPDDDNCCGCQMMTTVVAPRRWQLLWLPDYDNCCGCQMMATVVAARRWQLLWLPDDDNCCGSQTMTTVVAAEKLENLRLLTRLISEIPSCTMLWNFNVADLHFISSRIVPIFSQIDPHLSPGHKWTFPCVPQTVP
jgi:hypothetical protein